MQTRAPAVRPRRAGVLPCAIGATACAMAQPPVAPVPAPACETRSPGGDLRQIRCLVRPPSNGQRFRFQANFSGGHDDTSASLEARLGDRPLVCGEGSKTSLFAEDGDVSLHCNFAWPDGAGQPLLLNVDLTWRHAEYVDCELRAD